MHVGYWFSIDNQRNSSSFHVKIYSEVSRSCTLVFLEVMPQQSCNGHLNHFKSVIIASYHILTPSMNLRVYNNRRQSQGGWSCPSPCSLMERYPEMHAVMKIAKNLSKSSNLPTWFLFDEFDLNSPKLSNPWTVTQFDKISSNLPFSLLCAYLDISGDIWTWVLVLWHEAIACIA